MKMLSEFKVVAAFHEIVDRAEHVLVIITPYFDPWTHLAHSLIQCIDRGVAVHMLLRGGEDQSKRETAARPFVERGARVQFLARLHAKVYFTEKQALLTSMNLIDASRESWEVATLFDATEDAASYRDIETMARDLFATVNSPAVAGRSVSRSPSAHSTPPTRTTDRHAQPREHQSGYCIRCGEFVAMNPANPLCRDCYSSWSEYGNADYPEKVCHLCGNRTASSMAKPLCRSCWEQAVRT